MRFVSYVTVIMVIMINIKVNLNQLLPHYIRVNVINIEKDKISGGPKFCF